MTAGSAYEWLPQHQEHVAETLGHVDQLIEHAGQLLHDYLKAGAFDLETVARGDQALVTVTVVRPLPAAVARYTADALTQLRAALEHTVYAEVEHQLGRNLTEPEALSLEMPAARTPAAFDQWLARKPRSALAPLAPTAQLTSRLRDLQPYQRRDADNHPLLVLVKHTNHAKHRTPTVAATLLGTVIPERPSPQLLLPQIAADRPIGPGDVLASSPRDVVIPLDIWPKVSVQRPHTGTWHVAMHELRELEGWVRTVALPLLIAGRTDVSALPPQFDTATGHESIRAGLATAGRTPAAQRAEQRIQADMGRDSLVEVLCLHPNRPDRTRIQTWVDSLTNEDVLAQLEALAQSRQDLRRLPAVIADILQQALSVTAATTDDAETRGDR